MDNAEWKAIVRGRKWKLTYRYTYTSTMGPDWTPKVCNVEFYTIGELANYFRWEPERGALVGYHRQQTKGYVPNTRSSNASLIIWFQDRDGSVIEEQFFDVKQLVQFFERYPIIATCFSYKSKTGDTGNLS
jgi:hypothetical protein